MIKSDKKLAEIKKVLEGGQKVEIEAMINHLRDSEPFEGVLKLLALFYDRTGDERLRMNISSFFNDLKENSARSEVIDSLNIVSQQETIAMLVSSCWQSGLDYSDHAAQLAAVYIDGDYNTSLECFTVLDTNSMMITEADKTLIINKLTVVRDTFDSPKQLLTKELISILSE